MIEGIALGILTWLSFVLSWWHMPEKIKEQSLKHPVITDIGAGILAFVLLSSISKSIIAVIGSIVCGLLINFSIMGGTWVQSNNDSELSTRHAYGGSGS